MSSSRLPGKVLAPVLGQPLIALQVERVSRASTLDQVILATSDQSSDDPIATLCESLPIKFFRGSLDDVLDRVYRAVSPFRPDHVVRLTGDCPLCDPALIDSVVECHLNTGAEYTSNVRPPTWPDGLDVEIMRFETLETAWREAKLPSEREHVTRFIARRPDRFTQSCLRNGSDLSNLRWTVDEPQDLEFVRLVFERLYSKNRAFSTEDVLELLSREPGIANLNSAFKRNEGAQRDCNKDTAFAANRNF